MRYILKLSETRYSYLIVEAENEDDAIVMGEAAHEDEEHRDDYIDHDVDYTIKVVTEGVDGVRDHGGPALTWGEDDHLTLTEASSRD